MVVVCPNCGASGDRIVKAKNKFRCLDCFKSFKYGKSSKVDAATAMAIVRAAMGFELMRDKNLDDENFKESDIVTEE